MDFYGDTIVRTQKKPFHWLSCAGEPECGAQCGVSGANVDRVMAISRILVRGGGHIGFTKEPPDKVLRTLWKLSHKAFVDSGRPLERVCTTFPPSRSYSSYSSYYISTAGICVGKIAVMSWCRMQKQSSRLRCNAGRSLEASTASCGPCQGRRAQLVLASI